MLPVGSSGGDTFILFNKGFICFYNQYKRGWTEGFCRGQLYQNISILSKKEKNKTSPSPKSQANMKAKYRWNSLSGPGGLSTVSDLSTQAVSQ